MKHRILLLSLAILTLIIVKPTKAATCPPSLVSPDNNAIVSSGPNVSWSACDGAVKYKVSVSAPGISSFSVFIQGTNINLGPAYSSIFNNANTGLKFTWSVRACSNSNCTAFIGNPSASRIFLWLPTPVIALNSKTNFTCNQYCANNYSLQCLSAGLNSPNYDNNQYTTYDEGYDDCGTQTSANLCGSMQMSDETYTCGGKPARWTYCKCGGNLLSPTPTRTPTPTGNPTPTLPPNTYLNSNSNSTCQTVCVSHAQVCDSIGLYTPADAGKYYHYYGNTGCHKDSGTCSTKMNSSFQNCEGNKADWTLCKCKIPACPPALFTPANNAILTTGPNLSWSSCEGAVKYLISFSAPGTGGLSYFATGTSINLGPLYTLIFNDTHAGLKFTWSVRACANSGCTAYIGSPSSSRAFWWKFQPSPTPTTIPNQPLSKTFGQSIINKASKTAWYHKCHLTDNGPEVCTQWYEFPFDNPSGTGVDALESYVFTNSQGQQVFAQTIINKDSKTAWSHFCQIGPDGPTNCTEWSSFPFDNPKSTGIDAIEGYVFTLNGKQYLGQTLINTASKTAWYHKCEITDTIPKNCTDWYEFAFDNPSGTGVDAIESYVYTNSSNQQVFMQTIINKQSKLAWQHKCQIGVNGPENCSAWSSFPFDNPKSTGIDAIEGYVFTATPISPTIPVNCVCGTNDACDSSCLFEKYPNVPYASPIKCVLSPSMFLSPPNQTNKNSWCQRNLRTKGDADGDGKVTYLLDYAIYLSGVTGDKIDPPRNPDFDGDGVVSNQDREIIIRSLQGK